MNRKLTLSKQAFCSAEGVRHAFGTAAYYRPARSVAALWRGDSGSSLIETALVLPFLILLLVGCVDYGRGFYTAIEVSSAAEAGALYGTLHPTDTAGMAAMAKMDAPDVSGLSATATYGCECADGSATSINCTSAPLCSLNVVQYVEVTTTATYQPTLPYPGISSNINLQNKVHLRTFN